MSRREIRPDSYMELLDVSAKAVMFNEAVMLAICQAVADKDGPQLERALSADAALRISLGGYLSGIGDKPWPNNPIRIS